MKDTIANFLKYGCPLGFPDKNLRVYCEFEVGAAYEDWEWIVEYAGKIVSCDKDLDHCLMVARNKLQQKPDVPLKEK